MNSVWFALAAWFALSAAIGAVYAWLHWRRSQARLRALKREAERLHQYYDNMRRVSHTN